MKKLIIAGGTGFLGSVIISYFKDSFDEIVLLSRLPAGRQESTIKDNYKTVIWDAKTIDDWATELDGADVLINMTGRSVDCRYHQKNKDLILNSRVDSTTVLGEAIAVCKNPPKVWLNSSTATIYRHSLDKEMDEEHGEIGNGFSVSVAKAWEKAFFEANTPSTRKVALRTAIVLGKEGGALQPMVKMTKLGLGGKQGSGDQKFSWIHEDDFVQIIDFCIKNTFGIPAPKPILEMGAFLIRTETELLLKSRNVIPKRLLEHGYTFSYQNLETALKELIT